MKGSKSLSFSLTLLATVFADVFAGVGVAAEPRLCTTSSSTPPDGYHYVPATLLVVLDRSTSMLNHWAESETDERGDDESALARLRNVIEQLRDAVGDEKLRFELLPVPSPCGRVHPPDDERLQCSDDASICSPERLNACLGKPISGRTTEILELIDLPAVAPRRNELTPLADALKEAREWQESASGNRVVLLVTDEIQCDMDKLKTSGCEANDGEEQKDLKEVQERLAPNLVWMRVGDNADLTDDAEQTAAIIERLRKLLERDDDTEEYEHDGYQPFVAVAREGEWACSGTLIAPRAVLTAAHCLPATHVLFGDDVTNARRVVAVTGQSRHPEADVAVLHIAERVRDVDPVAYRSANDNDPPASMKRHVGFGATDPNGNLGFGKKHVIDLPVTGWGCDVARAERFGCNPEHELAVTSTGGLDTCTGDSGGALVESRRVGKECAWRVLGVTSRALAHSRFTCGEGGIYVRIDSIADWVNDQLDHQGKDK